MSDLTTQFTPEQLNELLDLASAAQGYTAKDKAVGAALDLVLAMSSQSGRDALTGFYTGRRFATGELFEQEQGSLPPKDLSALSMRHRFDHPVDFRATAVAVDMRKFFEVNGTFGFQTGDAILKVVAAKLQEEFPTGIMVRLHGDAFAAVFPSLRFRELSRDLRSRVQADIREAIHAMPEAPTFGEFPFHVTVALLDLTIHAPLDNAILASLLRFEIERELVAEADAPSENVTVRSVEVR